jgi:hypothetical protein
MKEQAPRDIAKILLETDLADRAVRRAVREAVLRHKLLGQSIVVSRNGEVVRVPPEEIEVPPEEPEPEPAR